MTLQPPLRPSTRQPPTLPTLHQDQEPPTHFPSQPSQRRLVPHNVTTLTRLTAASEDEETTPHTVSHKLPPGLGRLPRIRPSKCQQQMQQCTTRQSPPLLLTRSWIHPVRIHPDTIGSYLLPPLVTENRIRSGTGASAHGSVSDWGKGECGRRRTAPIKADLWFASAAAFKGVNWMQHRLAACSTCVCRRCLPAQGGSTAES